MDCFITKLKGTCDNADILKVDELPIMLNANRTGYARCAFSYGGTTYLDGEIRILAPTEDTHLSTSASASGQVGTNYTFTNKRDIEVYASEDVAVLTIPNKKEIGSLGRYGSSLPTQQISIDLFDLSECTSLSQLYLTNCTIFGDFKWLPNKSNFNILYIRTQQAATAGEYIHNDVKLRLSDLSAMTNLSNLYILVNGDVSGNIEDLPASKNLGNITIDKYSDIEGDIRNLVNKLNNAGRTGTINMTFGNYSKITLDGVAVAKANWTATYDSTSGNYDIE